MNTSTTTIQSKNHKNPQYSNVILFQQTITCSKSLKSTLEQCIDDTDPNSLSPTSTDHCLLNDVPQKCR